MFCWQIESSLYTLYTKLAKVAHWEIDVWVALTEKSLRLHLHLYPPFRHNHGRGVIFQRAIDK